MYIALSKSYKVELVGEMRLIIAFRSDVARSCWPCAGADQNEDVEIPWWTYGARGMQLWFPKTLEEPLLASAASTTHYATDPELEFDREVYPIGVSLSEVSIVGEPCLNMKAENVRRERVQKLGSCSLQPDQAGARSKCLSISHFCLTVEQLPLPRFSCL